MSIVMSIEKVPHKRDAILVANQVRMYMQDRYLGLMAKLAIQAQKEKKIFEEFDGVIALQEKCRVELGYA